MKSNPSIKQCLGSEFSAVSVGDYMISNDIFQFFLYWQFFIDAHEQQIKILFVLYLHVDPSQFSTWTLTELSSWEICLAWFTQNLMICLHEGFLSPSPKCQNMTCVNASVSQPNMLQIMRDPRRFGFEPKRAGYSSIRQCMHIFFCCISNHEKLWMNPSLQSVKVYQFNQRRFESSKTALVSIKVKCYLDHWKTDKEESNHSTWNMLFPQWGHDM
jgi:hypothetical protein